MEDLLSFLTNIHTEKTSNNLKKQQQQAPETNTLKRDKNSQTTPQAWDKVERRKSQDRRRIKVKRGRWLDSRQNTDRRKNLNFYTQI